MFAKSRLISSPVPWPHPLAMWGRREETGGCPCLSLSQLSRLEMGIMGIIEKIIFLAVWNIYPSSRDEIKSSVIFNVWLAPAQHFPRTEKQEIISWKPVPRCGWERNLIAKLFQVATNSLAAKIGLKPNDFLNSIAGKEVFQMTHEEVRASCLSLALLINHFFRRRRQSWLLVTVLTWS